MDFRIRTHDEIRRHGGVGNLNEGIEIAVHGLPTRLIAWPGNGFQTQSVHVVTHRPGDASDRYAYPMGEEAAVCVQGTGEVWLHGRWVDVAAGDVAYWPPGVEHATRNARGAARDFVLVTQLTPPPFDLYEPAGFYDRGAGAMRHGVIAQARRVATPGRLASDAEPLQLSQLQPQVRAWNLDVEQVRSRGALFNLLRGAAFDVYGIPLTLVAWPGYGTRSSNVAFGAIDPGSPTERHTHPVSDECAVVWDGEEADLELNGQLVRLGRHDVLLAPCGVEHGGGPNLEQQRVWLCRFASPPPLDLLMRSGYYDGRSFAAPPSSELATPSREREQESAPRA